MMAANQKQPCPSLKVRGVFFNHLFSAFSLFQKIVTISPSFSYLLEGANNEKPVKNSA